LPCAQDGIVEEVHQTIGMWESGELVVHFPTCTATSMSPDLIKGGVDLSETFSLGLTREFNHGAPDQDDMALDILSRKE